MSPSTTLAKQIEGMRTAIATSGDLKNLLMYEVEKQLQAKREQLKTKMNTLVYIGELYVAIMVITPVLFILVISILTILGNGSGGAVLQLNVIVFIGIPILGAFFTLILDQTLGREE
jgi:archaellum biogenesis protein FlaJ (TadC family)